MNDSIVEIAQKYKKGTVVSLGDKGEAIVCTDLIKFKNFYAIYADLVEDKCKELKKGPCFTTGKMLDGVAIVFRNKRILKEEIGLNSEERKAIYCHELGHCFSSNQTKGKEELTEEEKKIMGEIDCDTFAVEQCDMSPYVLKSALEKTYTYDIKSIEKKPHLTKERIDRYIKEMTARIKNAERLIREYENNKNSKQNVDDKDIETIEISCKTSSDAVMKILQYKQMGKSVIVNIDGYQINSNQIEDISSTRNVLSKIEEIKASKNKEDYRKIEESTSMNNDTISEKQGPKKMSLELAQEELEDCDIKNISCIDDYITHHQLCQLSNITNPDDIKIYAIHAYNHDKIGGREIGDVAGLYCFNKKTGKLEPMHSKFEEKPKTISVGQEVEVTHDDSSVSREDELITLSYSGLNLTWYKDEDGKLNIAKNTRGKMQKIYTRTLEDEQEFEKDKEEFQRYLDGEKISEPNIEDAKDADDWHRQVQDALNKTRDNDEINIQEQKERDSGFMAYMYKLCITMSNKVVEVGCILH